MLPRGIVIAVAPADPTTIIGVGREGVLNGGSSFVLTVDGTGDALPSVPGALTRTLTLVIYYRSTPTASLIADATTVTITTVEGKKQIEISAPQTGNYEIVVTASLAAGAAKDEEAVVSCQTVRA